MERIIINETDLTSNFEGVTSYDVAYVPGFMVINDGNAEEYFRKPTLFSNRYTFETAIGGTAPTFADIQYYPKWEYQVSDGFPKRAIPESEIMFDNGDSDLGYRIAHYLLSLGIPVYYEVMNNETGGEGSKYSIVYNYKKMDSTTEVFNPDLTYYTLKNPSVTSLTLGVENGASNVSQLTVDKITSDQDAFSAKVKHVNGTYVFTGVAKTEETSGGEDEVIIEWKYNNDVVDLTTYGLTIADFTPTENDTFTLSAILVLDFPDTQQDLENVEPATDASLFEPVPAETTGWGQVPFYVVMGADEHCPPTVETMYKGLFKRFSETSIPKEEEGGLRIFDTIGDYSIKYFTTGGYPVFEYATKEDAMNYALMGSIIDTAAKRSDAIALIDHTNNPKRDVYPATLGGTGESVIDIARTVCTNLGDNGSYAAIFTPWYSCAHTAIAVENASPFVPASVGYLSALAMQIRNYNPWLAVSGVTRGRVPNLTVSTGTADDSLSLHTVQKITNNVADSYQVLPNESGDVTQISINPITYIRNNGYCIWGNRTLRNNSTGTSALSFLNVRSMVSDIKKLLYQASQQTLFEQNTDITWINFKGVITPFLDRLVSNYILTDYSVTRYLIDPEDGTPVPAYKVLAIIRIQPINSIEVFDLTVQLENSEIFVAEQ